MAGKQGGSHKKYGRKLDNPRISRSKEHRGCGPLGRYLALKNWLEGKGHRPTRLPAFMLVQW